MYGAYTSPLSLPPLFFFLYFCRFLSVIRLLPFFFFFLMFFFFLFLPLLAMLLHLKKKKPLVERRAMSSFLSVLVSSFSPLHCSYTQKTPTHVYRGLCTSKPSFFFFLMHCLWFNQKKKNVFPFYMSAAAVEHFLGRRSASNAYSNYNTHTHTKKKKRS